MVKSKQTKFVYGYEEQTDQIRVRLRANRPNVWLRSNRLRANRPNSCMVKSKQTKFVYG